MNESMKQRHHVVIIGSGFGGLFATKALKDASVDVTVIAKTNHHLFQPLLYQWPPGSTVPYASDRLIDCPPGNAGAGSAPETPSPPRSRCAASTRT